MAINSEAFVFSVLCSSLFSCCMLQLQHRSTVAGEFPGIFQVKNEADEAGCYLQWAAAQDNGDGRREK